MRDDKICLMSLYWGDLTVSLVPILVLLFWYRLTQVVLEKRLLNGCSGSGSSSSSSVLQSGRDFMHFTAHLSIYDIF